jgi:hypothetical protein
LLQRRRQRAASATRPCCQASVCTATVGINNTLNAGVCRTEAISSLEAETTWRPTSQIQVESKLKPKSQSKLKFSNLIKVKAEVTSAISIRQILVGHRKHTQTLTESANTGGGLSALGSTPQRQRDHYYSYLHYHHHQHHHHQHHHHHHLGFSGFEFIQV